MILLDFNVEVSGRSQPSSYAPVVVGHVLSGNLPSC
jgi:hypothetical protein